MRNELGSNLSTALLAPFQRNNWKPVDEAAFAEFNEINLEHFVEYGYLAQLKIIGKKESRSKYMLCDPSTFLTTLTSIDNIFEHEGVVLELIASLYFREKGYKVSLVLN